MMGDLSKHFSRWELNCKCGKKCGWDEQKLSPLLIEKLEEIRRHFGLPVSVHCALRCPDHNRSIGSKDTSQHIKGTAADIHIDGISHSDLYQYIDSMILHGWGGLGLYPFGVHIDVRKEKARWRVDV